MTGPPDSLEVIEMPANAAVALWLAAGYLYEAESFELIPDVVWHALCARLAADYDSLAHPLGHHRLIERESLATGTCAYLKPEDYPPIARGLAQALARAWHNREIEYRILPAGNWSVICAGDF